MTTKKSKPASLTSSLLARKGEAEPAAAPYSIPESGRQRDPDAPVSKSKGNGNGNGGDLGHALSGMTRLPGAVHEPKSAGSENGAQSEAVKPVAPAHSRPLPLQMQAPVPAASAPSAPPPSAQVPAAQERAADPDSAEALVLGGAMAEEASIDEAVIEAAAPVAATPSAAAPAAAPAASQKPAAPAASETVRRAGPGGTGSDDGEVEKEAARDARLLRFVYVMAALTGIVAIILYAGGWLREGPQQRAPEEAVATAPATTEAVSPAPAPVPETTGETPAIPPAPPVSAPAIAPPSVSPPMVAESAPGSPVTTGGPAKARPESPAPSAGETASGAGAPAAQLSSPAEPPVAMTPSETPPATPQASAPARDDGAKSPGTAAPSGGTSSAKSVTGDEGAGQAAGKPVRDVPNMRVLAPAVGKPELAQSAPPPASVPEPGNVPVLTAPAATQSASVPKTAPQKPAASSANAAGSGFLVQLASVNSEKLAEREWARLQKAFPDLFGSRDLTIEKKEIAGRGTFYRVQTGGYASLDEARAVCGDLKAKKQACLPVNR